MEPPQPPAAHAAPADRLLRDGLRHVHGDPRHPDRLLVARPRSRPGLSAGADEIAWVQTSYLIAEVIMIPLSGFLGAGAVDAVCSSPSRPAASPLTSVLCATATSIDQMIVYRALQGFIGGGMIPTVFAATYTLFPQARQGLVIGADRPHRDAGADDRPDPRRLPDRAFSWHWLFLVNVVARHHRHGCSPGPSSTSTSRTLRCCSGFDFVGPRAHGAVPRQPRIRARGGPRNDWFEDRRRSCLLAVVCAVGGVCSSGGR